jgi:hypothetical protein
LLSFLGELPLAEKTLAAVHVPPQRPVQVQLIAHADGGIN